MITYCKSQFSHHGVPDTLIPDNGPQFSSIAFKRFAKYYRFEHYTTNPQSNGMAEKTFQTAKNLLKQAVADSKDPYLAPLEYCNTPLLDQLGLQPKDLWNEEQRHLRISTCEKLLHPKIIITKIVVKEKKRKTDDRYAKPLENLVVRDLVMMLIKNHWKPAKVTAFTQNTSLTCCPNLRVER